MELALNLAWALVAIATLGVWLGFAPRAGAERRVQLTALAVLILILFPVISVTDDLLATQNPAETDSCVRRAYVSSHAHSNAPITSALPPRAFAGLFFGAAPIAAPRALSAAIVEHPGLSEIQNRPPPAA